MKRIPLAAAVAVAALTAALAACSAKASSDAHPAASASAAVSSALANPTVSSDLNATEQQLLNNLKANFNPAHPKTSVENAVKATFPHGDVSKIVTYAVQTFTLSVLHTSGPGSARDQWLQAVVTYAQAQGAHPAPSTSATPTATAS